jgi:hypothetical protein
VDQADERPRSLRSVGKFTGPPAFVLPGLLVPLVLACAVSAAPRPRTSEVAAVQGFLAAAVVNHDGEAACSYLTPGAREEFERHGAGPTCQMFFAATELPGVDSIRQIKALNYAVRDNVVSVDGLRLRLVRGGPPEFHPPPEPWRIAAFSAAPALHAYGW